MPTTPPAPTTPAPTKATSAWSKLNLQQQQDFVKSHDGFDPSKYWLQYASAAPKALDYNLPWETPSTPQVPAVNPTPSPTTTATTPPQAAQPAWAALAVWTEPTTGTPNYQDDSEARLLETQNNLQAYYNQNPDLFTDRPTFDSTFHYGERSNLQKQTLDNFYNKRQYETQFGNLTSDDIAKKLVNAEITDTDLNWMKAYDAARYNEVMQKRAEQQTQIDNQNTLATMATQAGFKWFEDQMGLKDVNNNGIFDSFEVNQSPELKAAQEKSIQLNTQIEDIDKETETIQKDIESHYGSLSKGQLAALVRDRTVDLTMKRNAAVRELTAVNGTAKNLLEAQQQQQQGIKDSLTAFQQMYGIYQTTPQGIVEQATAKYAAEHPNMDTGTPQQQQMALNQTLDNYFKDYGAIIMRPQAQVVSDVLALAKSKGISVSQALKENFLTPLQAKPEYKAILKKSIWEDKWVTFWVIWQVDGVNQYWFIDINGKTVTPLGGSKSSDTSSRTERQAIMDNIVSSSWGNTIQIAQWLSQIPDGSIWWTCWQFANDYALATVGTKLFGDSLADKPTNSKTGRVWDFIVINSGAKLSDWTPAWHVGIITAINKNDWTVTVKSSNYNNDNKVRTDTIAMNNPKIKGYYKIDHNALTQGTKNPEVYINAANNLLQESWASAQNKAFAIKQIKKYVEAGDFANAKTSIMGLMKGNLLADEKATYNLVEETPWILNRLSTKLSQYKWPMNVFVGTEEQIANKIGKIKNKEMSALANEILTDILLTRKKISGAAFSTQEAEDYAKMFPSILNEWDLNQAKIKGTIDALNSNRESFLRNRFGNNYDAIFGWNQQHNTNQFDITSLFPSWQVNNINNNDWINFNSMPD